ncbi:tetratricopeptide repeat protein, partial [Limnospira sp. PMC 1245.20]
DEAIAAYQKAIKKDANQNIFSDLSIYTLQRLGDALINRKDWEQAISCYHRLLDLKPDYFQHIYDALGTCFIETKRWEYVAQVYKKAITQVEVMPQQAYNNLFKSYEQLGHFDEAVNVCKEAIKLMPTYPGS